MAFQSRFHQRKALLQDYEEKEGRAILLIPASVVTAVAVVLVAAGRTVSSGEGSGSKRALGVATQQPPLATAAAKDLAK